MRPWFYAAESRELVKLSLFFSLFLSRSKPSRWGGSLLSLQEWNYSAICPWPNAADMLISVEPSARNLREHIAYLH